MHLIQELTEKLQNMRFQLQLCSVEDLKTPILQRQNNLRYISMYCLLGEMYCGRYFNTTETKQPEVHV